MKYEIELDKEVFKYMKNLDGSVERYFQNRVFAPIFKQIEDLEKKKLIKKQEKELNKKLKQLRKTIIIKAKE